MGVLEQLAKGIEYGREQYEHIRLDADSFKYSEKHVYDDYAEFSELALGDNLKYMKRLIDDGYSGKFKLLYLDPPFFTKAKYNATVSVKDSNNTTHKIHHLAYDDRFERNLEYYAENMTVRLLTMKELLADDGLIWVHLVWH